MQMLSGTFRDIIRIGHREGPLRNRWVPCVTVSGWTQMDNIVRGYARLTPLAHLRLSSESPGTFNRVHDVLLNNVLLDTHLRAYPPAPEYQLKFWKWAVQKLEVLIGDEVSLQVSHGVAPFD